MVELRTLTRFIDDYLGCARFIDAAPNGLQVEGRSPVRRIISGVTASFALIEAAIAAGADALLVHHGYFWKGEDPCLVGMKKRRIETLLRHGVSLLAYHLPLDAHPQCGNNAQLAQRLGMVVDAPDSPAQPPLVWRGSLPEPLSAAEFGARLRERLGREPLYAGPGVGVIRTVAWCTGAGQKYIDAAADLGVDAYLTGEVSEPTVHVARERPIHFYAAGHHATERYGVQALGKHLAQRFGIEHRFVDVENPA